MRYILIVLAIIFGIAYFYQQNRAPQPDPQPLPGNSERYAAPPAIAHPDVPAGAWKFYEDAKDAVSQRELARAENDLKHAVAIKPDFTEAWYNLGATQANMAIDAMRHNQEGEAVALFRNAVENKKKSRELMIQGKWFEYNKEQQGQTRQDVETALAEADAVTHDEKGLIEGLREWAGQ